MKLWGKYVMTKTPMDDVHGSTASGTNMTHGALLHMEPYFDGLDDTWSLTSHGALLHMEPYFDGLEIIRVKSIICY